MIHTYTSQFIHVLMREFIHAWNNLYKCIYSLVYDFVSAWTYGWRHTHTHTHDRVQWKTGTYIQTHNFVQVYVLGWGVIDPHMDRCTSKCTVFTYIPNFFCIFPHMCTSTHLRSSIGRFVKHIHYTDVHIDRNLYIYISQDMPNYRIDRQKDRYAFNSVHMQDRIHEYSLGQF